MNVLGALLTQRGQRRGPRRPVRITSAEPPRHAVPKPPIDWMVSPYFDDCPESDAISWDLIGLRQAPLDTTPRETIADCGTPDHETAATR